MSAIIIIFSLLFAYLSGRRTEWSIYLVIAFLPAYLIRFSVFGVPMTLLEAMILILFVVSFFSFFMKREPAGGKSRSRLVLLKNFKNNYFFWPMIAILIFATASVFVSPNLRGAAGIWKAYFIEPILFFIVLISAIKTKKQLQNIFWALGVSALYLGLFALWQKFSAFGVPPAFLNPNGTVDRVVSVFGYPNALGLFLGPIIILFTGWLFYPPIFKGGRGGVAVATLKFLIILLSFATIVLAKSEAAILSVVFIWLLGGLFYKKTRWLFVAVIIITVLTIIFVPTINQYFSSKLLLQDYSGYVRRLIWQESGRMLGDNWFWGAGLAGYQMKIAPYHLPTFEIYLYPHNLILNFWSELGLLGLLSFGWLFVMFIWLNVKAFKTKETKFIAIILMAVMIQQVIHGLVDAPYFKNDLAVLFWLIMAIAIINNKLISDFRHQKSDV